MAHKSYPFYNVSHSVGKNGLNNGDDVWLVQYMLMQIAQDPALGASAPDEPLRINGVYTPLLDVWIRWFQELVRARGGLVYIDSRIDPFPAPRKDGYCRSAMPDHFHTIGHLNATFRRRYRAKHDHLEDQPELLGIRKRLAADDYAPPLS